MPLSTSGVIGAATSQDLNPTPDSHTAFSPQSTALLTGPVPKETVCFVLAVMESGFKPLVPQSNCWHSAPVCSRSLLSQAPGLICLITARHDPEHEPCAAARTSAAPAAKPTAAAAAEAPARTLQREQAGRGERKQSKRTRRPLSVRSATLTLLLSR